MNLTKCQVKECGARVLLVSIGGDLMALNPIEFEVALPNEQGDFRLVKGFQPHSYTCVDLQARHPRRGGGQPSTSRAT